MKRKTRLKGIRKTEKESNENIDDKGSHWEDKEELMLSKGVCKVKMKNFFYESCTWEGNLGKKLPRGLGETKGRGGSILTSFRNRFECCISWESEELLRELAPL